MSNRTTRRWLWVALSLLLVGLLLVACGGKEEPVEEEPPWQLPRLTIQVDEEGVPKVFGILSLDTVARLLRQDLSAFYLAPDQVQRLEEAGVQHLEVLLAEPGVFTFVNGDPMPYLAADDESWANLNELIEQAAPDAPAVGWVLDVVQRIGIPVVVKLPVPEGNEEVPLRNIRDVPRVDTEAARSAVTDPSLIAYADIELDEQGVPIISGMSMADLQAALQESGVQVDLSGVRLDPALIGTLGAAKIQHLQIETEPEGVYLYVNGKRLPRIAWDDARLQNALGLFGELSPDSPALPFLAVTLPGIQPADVELTLFLPLTAETDQLPVSPFIQRE